MSDAATLKQLNLQKIRNAFLEGEPFSKTELAEKTGLSFPTVGKIIDEMVNSHQLQIVGMRNSSGGRCSRIYQYNPDFHNAIALILEGPRLDWFVLDSLGMTKNQGRIEIESDSDLFDTLAGLLLQARRQEPSLCGFCLGIAANTNGETVQQSFEYPQLKGINLLKELECVSGLKGSLGNDMWISAEGCWQRCRMNDQTTLISFYLGSCGFGSSFVIGGKTLKGAHQVAGEIELLPWIRKEGLNMNTWPEALPEAILHCILTYAIITDPDFIQLYTHPFFIRYFDEIQTQLNACFSGVQPPVLLLSDDFRADYEIGLSRRAMQLMNAMESSL